MQSISLTTPEHSRLSRVQLSDLTRQTVSTDFKLAGDTRCAWTGPCGSAVVPVATLASIDNADCFIAHTVVTCSVASSPLKGPPSPSDNAWSLTDSAAAALPTSMHAGRPSAPAWRRRSALLVVWLVLLAALTEAAEQPKVTQQTCFDPTCCRGCRL